MRKIGRMLLMHIPRNEKQREVKTRMGKRCSKAKTGWRREKKTTSTLKTVSQLPENASKKQSHKPIRHIRQK